jgi:hypothetical protein
MTARLSGISAPTALLRTVAFFFLILGFQTSASDLQAQSWIGTVPTLETRTSSVAITLADGRLLFAGGIGPNGPLATAEIFDGFGFISAPRLSQERARAAAVRLHDGRILIAGGDTPEGPTSSAEIYDPHSNSWTSPSPMVEGRVAHTLTLLPDGRVLVAGGQTGGGITGTAEIFDPATETFSRIGNLVTPRSQHAAVMLDDGRVLLAGGVNATSVLSATEIYDSTSGTFQHGPALVHSRKLATAATLFDGRTLIVGGHDGTTEVGTAELLSLSDNFFVPLAGPSVPGNNAVGLFLPDNGSVLMAGGSVAAQQVQSAHLFEPWNSLLRNVGDMNSSHTGGSGAASPRGFAVVGGGDSADVFYFPTVATDKADYAPGEIVTVSGRGWQPGETIQLTVRERPMNHADLTFTAVADTLGNFLNNQFSPEAHHAGVDFLLTAVGVSSQKVAQTRFSDAVTLYTATINPVAITVGTSQTYVLTFTNHATSTEPITNFTLNIPGGFSAVTLLTTPWNVTGDLVSSFNFQDGFLLPGQSINTTISATAPCTTGNHVWSTTAFRRLGSFSRTNFSIAGPQPSVEVQGACPLTVLPQSASVTTVEGGSAGNTGTYFSPTAGDNVLLTASIGTISKSGTSNGTWSWSFPTSDGPDQSQTVVITAADPRGGTAQGTFSLTVRNSGPNLSNLGSGCGSFSGCPTIFVSEGATVSLGASFSDPGIDTHTATATYGDGISESLTIHPGNTINLAHAYLDNGSYTLLARVTDSDGDFAQRFRSVSVSNVAPVVNAGSDTTLTGSTLALTGTFADPGADTWVGTVTYGDSTPVQPLAIGPGKTFSLNHVYVTAGVFTVTVSVRDDDNGLGSDTVQVTVNNLPPVVNAGADREIDEGATLLQMGSFADTGKDTWTATVNYGDGSGAIPLLLNPDKTFTLNHQYSDNGSYNVTVTVSDQLGSGSDSFVVLVRNVAPTISDGTASSVEGSTFIRTQSFADPGSDSWSATVDYGDGSGVHPLSLAGKTFVLSHTYVDNGSYVITVRVTDDDGAVGAGRINVAVDNAAPNITTLSLDAASIAEGGTAVLTGSLTDAGLADWHTLQVNWGDGTPNSTITLGSGVRNFVLSHLYVDDNPTATSVDTNTITVIAIDKDAGQGSGTTSMTVSNLTPTVTMVSGPAGPVAIGLEATINAAYSDAGVDDTHLCEFSWDDGTSSVSQGTNGSCSSSRFYATPGVYTVRVSVSDDDTGATSYTHQFVVVYDPEAGFVTGGGWIHSAPGSYSLDPDLSGKANFGFVAKYHKGATLPEGQTQFEFRIGDLKFHSTTYDWLVVAGHKAQYKGSGTINGNGIFTFQITAIDGDKNAGNGVDKFRIKIVDKLTDTVIYDNAQGAADDMDDANPQDLGGGSIMIHSN